MEVLETDITDSGQNHGVGTVVCLHEIQDVLAMETLHQSTGTQDIPTQWMVFEHRLLKHIVDLLRRHVEVRVDLIQHHVFLFFQLILRESGLESDVRKQVHGAFVIDSQERSLQAGLLFRGESVEVTPNVVEAAQNMIGLAVLRAFEDGMLDEMGHAVLRFLFVARTCADHQNQMCDFTFFLPVKEADAVG